MPSPSFYRFAFAALALAVLVGRSSAADPEPASKIDLAKEVGELVKVLKEQLTEQRSVNTKVLDLVAKQDRLIADLKELRDDVVIVKKEMAEAKSKPAVSATELQSLRDEIAGLKRQLDDMRKSVTTSSAKVSQSAKIRFINRYPEAMTAYVNGSTFVVPAHEDREVAVAPGSVIYQILGHQATAKFNTLNDREMLTVTLKPTS